MLRPEKRNDACCFAACPPPPTKKSGDATVVMFSNQSAELSVGAPSRAVASVSADRQRNRFLVGTCRLSRPGDGGGADGGGGDDDNCLHLIRFHEEANELGVDAVLDHPTGEVWCLSPCPYDKGLVATCGGGGGGGYRTNLWRIPDEVIERDDDWDYDADNPMNEPGMDVGDGMTGGGS